MPWRFTRINILRTERGTDCMNRLCAFLPLTLIHLVTMGTKRTGSGKGCAGKEKTFPKCHFDITLHYCPGLRVAFLQYVQDD